MRAIHRKRLRALGGFVLVGGVVGLVVGFVINQIDLGPVGPSLVRGAIAGLLIGGLVGATEEIYLVGAGRRLNYFSVSALRLVHYTVSVTLTLVLVNSGYAWMTDETGLVEAIRGYLLGATFLRDVLFTFVVAVLGTAWLETRKLHNPGDLRRFLLGRYRQPEEETRIFLFTDLEDSTGLAEKLGNMAYSRMLADCFYHMSEAVLAWRGQIYQYVGDQIVITWPYEEGVDKAACVRCFFDMTQALESRGE